MKFSINSLILWSKKKPTLHRVVPFYSNAVNIITGASRTGKSAIIPIIDYCLGAEKCTIPVDTIRNSCEWFGVVFELEKEQLLLCRKEPGNQSTTGEMYIQRNSSIVIPDEIISNITAAQVKNILNELFSMSALELDVNNGFFMQRPSYRDIMAFLFQPQNIVANADVLFYKADTMEHKQKLINIFPYILGAVTPEVLNAKQEIERLLKNKKRIEHDLQSIKKSTIAWNQEVKSWLSQARELGLTNYMPDDSATFEQSVERLKSIVSKSESDSNIFFNNIKDMSDELVALRKEEQEYSNALYSAQRRYSEMKQLTQTANSYEKSLQVQLGRLNISGWMRDLAKNNEMLCPICGSDHSTGLNKLDLLCEAIAELEKTAGDMQTVPASFERELKSVEAEIRTTSEKLAAVKNRITRESGKLNSNAAKKYTLTEVARFLGNMERAIKTYELLGADSELQYKLTEIDAKLIELRKKINEGEIQKRVESALSYIAQEANKIVPQLDVERPGDPIEFVIKDLTIMVKNQTGRDDYLWEIGSASNWLAYHIALMLAFQKFFQLRMNSSVPNFIIFDQPSQVYFPHKAVSNNKNSAIEESSLDDEDKAAVKKIFTALSTYMKDTKEVVQIIVTEHADDDIWGGIENVHLIERWRNGNKLVPIDWINTLQ